MFCIVFSALPGLESDLMLNAFYRTGIFRAEVVWILGICISVANSLIENAKGANERNTGNSYGNRQQQSDLCITNARRRGEIPAAVFICDFFANAIDKN